MDLIHINYDIFLVASVDGIKKYDEVFSDEIGDLPGTVHLQVDENVICQQKETLMPHEVPTRPWEKVGFDLFTLKGLNYLVIVDYYSNFIEVDHLENTDTKTVIRKLKLQFARHRLPCQLVSDNGPQLVSDEFHKFAKKWDFEHYMSSPHNSSANGMAESPVNMFKRIMK